MAGLTQETQRQQPKWQFATLGLATAETAYMARQ
jgi:hypothetical protein